MIEMDWATGAYTDTVVIEINQAMRSVYSGGSG
jgi:hypothetical protein